MYHSSVKKKKGKRKKNDIGEKKKKNYIRTEFRSYNYRLAVPTFNKKRKEKKMNEKPCITSRVSSM